MLLMYKVCHFQQFQVRLVATVLQHRARTHVESFHERQILNGFGNRTIVMAMLNSLNKSLRI